MCGIAGIVMTSGSVGFDQSLQSMASSLGHRGPDDQGVAVKEADGWRVGLAHTRLAILDLSNAGSQPMSGAGRRLCITYNGEVYNFTDLHNELPSRFRE